MMPVSARNAPAAPARDPACLRRSRQLPRDAAEMPGQVLRRALRACAGSLQQNEEAVAGTAEASDHARLRVHRLAVAGKRGGGTAWLRERQGGRVWTGRA